MEMVQRLDYRQQMSLRENNYKILIQITISGRMLIRSLFNLETNSPANLPNEYFLILEKQQKYKDLHHKLLKLNLHNQNLIQSISTIKITLLELVDQFIKPQETSFVTKIQQALISTFSSLDQVCSNLQKNIDTKISNYQSHIESLSKQYKEKLQQVTHYRKKVDSIKKGPLDTKQDKDKLTRNMEKRRVMQKQCQKAETLLIQNYQNFHQQSHEFLKTVPHQILFHLVEGNIQTASHIIEIVGDELPVLKRRPRKQSIMSSKISQISDADALSEYSEEDVANSNEIKIMGEPQSDQILNEDHLRTQKAKNQDTIDDQNFSKSRSPRNWRPQTMNLKRSLLRKSSIEDQLKNKTHLIQKLKKLLLTQTFGLQYKPQNPSHLQKAFETIEAPLTHEQKIKQIFQSTKNKFCDPNSKFQKRNQQKAEKTNLKSFHEKSFVLEKQEFKNKHSLRSIKIVEIKGKGHLRNEETLNCPSDQQEVQYKSPKYQDNAVSISSKMSRNNSPSGNEFSGELSMNSPTNVNINALNRFDRQTIVKNDDKSVAKKSSENANLQVPGQLKHHPTYDHLPNYQYGSVQEIKKLPSQSKQSRFGEADKNKATENMFSVSNQKINEKKLFEKNPFQAKPFNFPTPSDKKPETQLKDMFSAAFPHQKSHEPRKEQITETPQTHNLKINEQKIYPSTTQNLKTLATKKQIDFSIFEKIV